MTATPNSYLKELSQRLGNPGVGTSPFNLVFHGHSIPCGSTVHRVVRPFDAYPHLVHREMNARFPTAVINAIVTAIGGECAVKGAKRMDTVIGHRPDLVMVDYGRNDVFESPDETRAAWRRIIESVQAVGSRVLLLTPAIDSGQLYYDPAARRCSDEEISEMVRELAAEYGVGCADVSAAFEHLLANGAQACDYMTGVNHPNRRGHEIIAREILRWIPIL